MTDDAVDPLTDMARMLDDVTTRLVDALPAIGRVIIDVERDWIDDRCREWIERASLVHRTLVRELDAALATSRAVGEALLADDGPDSEHRRIGPAEADRPGVVASRAGGARTGGPRLGDTDGERVDDERGMRIARLHEDGDGPS